MGTGRLGEEVDKGSQNPKATDSSAHCSPHNRDGDASDSDRTLKSVNQVKSVKVNSVSKVITWLVLRHMYVSVTLVIISLSR